MLRRSFELRGEEYAEGFRFVGMGVSGGERGALEDGAALRVTAELVETGETGAQQDGRRAVGILGGCDDGILQRWVATGDLAELVEVALQFFGRLPDKIGGVDQRGDVADEAGEVAALPLPTADPADRDAELRKRGLHRVEVGTL